jgi:Flp pilus assembly protein TadB
MHNDRPPRRRVTYGKGVRIGGSGWFGRLLAIVLSAIVLVATALLSVVLFAALLAVGTIVVGYLWWKTRALRRQARARAFGDDDRIIDVEVVHRNSPDDDSMKR